MGREHRVYVPYSRAAHGVSFYCFDTLGAFFLFLFFFHFLLLRPPSIPFRLLPWTSLGMKVLTEAFCAACVIDEWCMLLLLTLLFLLLDVRNWNGMGRHECLDGNMTRWVVLGGSDVWTHVTNRTSPPT